MDELTNLMRLIDLNSEIIPEGHYLEMCNSMKKVHETLSNVNSSCDSDSDEDGIENFIMREVMRDGTIVSPPIPFSTENRNRNRYYEENDDDDVVLTADADEREQLLNYVNSLIVPPINVPRMSDEIDRLQSVNREFDEAELRRLDERILQIRRTIRNTKPRQRITANVRKEAVKKRAQELGIRLPRYTIGNLLDKGHNVGNEREFYKSYLDGYNEEIEHKLKDLNDDLIELLRDKDTLLDEMNSNVD
ncbi:hypothetical protein [Bathycoccus sp. RCC716 virus 3]|nr:hypothetical protein [Bathycoccus sp. RCC716 virus 3]